MAESRAHGVELPREMVWDVECAVLGAALISEHAANVAVTLLTQNHFRDPRHRDVFRCIFACVMRNVATRPSEIIARAQRELWSVDIGEYLAFLFEGVATTENIHFHVGLLLKNPHRHIALVDSGGAQATEPT